MARQWRLVIPGRLPGLNELIDAERAHRQQGGRLKREAEHTVRWYIRQQLRSSRPEPPVMLYYHFVEPNKRRDKDNIAAFAHKVIQDSLVKERFLHNDGWDYVEGFADSFSVDKKSPRVEVLIVESERGNTEQ